MRTSGVRAVASSDTRSRDRERDGCMDGTGLCCICNDADRVRTDYQRTPDTRVMKVVIHGIAKECGQCGEVPSIRIIGRSECQEMQCT